MQQPSSRFVPALISIQSKLASFEVVSLIGRTLRFADLTASELFSADLTDADLQHAVLSGTTLKKADLAEAKLQGASLNGAQLQGADLRGAQLQGTYLSQAQLQQANLGDAQLQGADLRGAQLQGAADHIRLGLADLRGGDFREVSAEDLLNNLPPGIPESEKQRVLRERLAAKVSGWGKMLPQVDTTDGKILITTPMIPNGGPSTGRNNSRPSPRTLTRPWRN
jgi:Pentapeptide repeats (8 copies)